MAASSLSTRTPPGRLFQAADHFVFASGYSFSPARCHCNPRGAFCVLIDCLAVGTQWTTPF